MNYDVMWLVTSYVDRQTSQTCPTVRKGTWWKHFVISKEKERRVRAIG